MTIDFVTFSLIIDDIVFPKGKTAMGMLGGGGPQTALGLKLWADNVGLVGGVGPDFPTEAQQWLDDVGLNSAGLRHSAEWPTPRAWQVLEMDGYRTQVWRIPGSVIGLQLGRSMDKLPPAYRQAKGYHLGVHPEEPDLDFISQLRTLGAIVSVEPFRVSQRPLTKAELHALISAGQIFSPNLTEAESLVGPGSALDLLERLAGYGAKIIALRQGAVGSTVHHTETGETWHIPAIETTVVDSTGAGNAFCGGFLAGWVQTSNLRTAGLYGAVAASFLVEQVGLPQVNTKMWKIAKKRVSSLKGSCNRIG